MRKAGKLKVSSFWLKILLTHAYGWLCLIISCVIVPRSWQEGSNKAKATGWRGVAKWITEGNSVKRVELRRRLLDTNAFLWLAGRNRIVSMWCVFACLGVIWFWCWGVFGKDWANKFNYIVSMLILHWVLKYFLSTEASRRFVEDRKSGALELLLSTSITVREILTGQRLAFVRLFSPAVLMVIVIDLLFLVAGLNERTSYSVRDQAFWTITCLIGIAALICDLLAMSWVGMWLGMTSRGANRAAAANWVRCVFLRWVVFVVSWMIIGIVFLRNSASWDYVEYIVLFYWFGLAVGFDLLFMFKAMKSLPDKFREIATQRFAFQAPKIKPVTGAPPITAHEPAR